MSNEHATQIPTAATVDLKLEVVVIPVSDGDRAKRSWASFSDPDGNGWLLQEIKARLPGRGLSMNVATLTELLREAEKRHGEYEPTAPKHHWSGWYAAYIVAREQGRTVQSFPTTSFRTTAARTARSRSCREAIYNSYWFFGRPTVEELRLDLRAVLQRCRPDWDISSAEQRTAWAKGEKASFYPYGKKQAQVLAEQD